MQMRSSPPTETCQVTFSRRNKQIGMWHYACLPEPAPTLAAIWHSPTRKILDEDCRQKHNGKKIVKIQTSQNFQGRKSRHPPPIWRLKIMKKSSRKSCLDSVVKSFWSYGSAKHVIDERQGLLLLSMPEEVPYIDKMPIYEGLSGSLERQRRQY